MRILNVLWGFSAGGIGKCFLSYNNMGRVSSEISVHSVCIDVRDKKNDVSALSQEGIDLISIAHRFDSSWMKALHERLKGFRPQVIFCHGFNGPLIVYALKQRYGIRTPMVCSFHGRYHAPTPMKRALSPVYNVLQRFMYRTAAARVITLEESSREHLIEKGIKRRKLVTIPNGIADEPLAVSEMTSGSEASIRLTTISRLDAVKGLQYLIKALPGTARAVSRPLKLSIVGDGPEREKLEALVKQLGVQHMVRFEGLQNDVSSWYNRADIFLLPSLSECHSISLLEAMRAGKPIIATNVGGNITTVRSGLDGILIPPADIDTLTAALVRLIEDESLRHTLGASARQRFTEHFTEEKMLGRLAETFKELI